MKKHKLYIKIRANPLALWFLFFAVAGQSMGAEAVDTNNTKHVKTEEAHPAANSKSPKNTSETKAGDQNTAKKPIPNKSRKTIKIGDSKKVVEARLGSPKSMQYRKYDGTQVYYYSKAHVVFKNGAVLRVGSNAAEKKRLASVARTYPSSPRKTARTRSVAKTSSNRRVTTAQSRASANERLKLMLLLAERSRARQQSQPAIIPFSRPYNYSYGSTSLQDSSSVWDDHYPSLSTSHRPYDYSYGTSLSYGSSALWDDNVGFGKQSSEYKYESMLGTKYKYDLSDPLDCIDYKTDIFAQQDDRINPMIHLDRNLGQYGGGAEW